MCHFTRSFLVLRLFYLLHLIAQLIWTVRQIHWMETPRTFAMMCAATAPQHQAMLQLLLLSEQSCSEPCSSSTLIGASSDILRL